MVEPIVTKKQFIAGAVCPDCAAVDRIVVETAAATSVLPEMSRRRCVNCAFADEFAEVKPRLSQAIPRGRAERSKKSEEQASVVRILQPTVGPKSKPGA